MNHFYHDKENKKVFVQTGYSPVYIFTEEDWEKVKEENEKRRKYWLSIVEQYFDCDRYRFMGTVIEEIGKTMIANDGEKTKWEE